MTMRMLSTASSLLCLAASVHAGGVQINEIDSDTAGTDTLEFIELSDGGAGNTPLDGLVVVLFNGSKVVDAQDSRRGSGTIGLQLAHPEDVRHANIEFRNLKVRKLP